MIFEELDKRMRAYEAGQEQAVLPGLAIVARLDGRGFTKLTKKQNDFAKPFDERFRDAMVETLSCLMTCGFNTIYGYTQSDEMSVLLHRDEDAFSRRLAKLTSVLAGEASATFSLALGLHGCFDCRIAQLPNALAVRDYFRWRAEDGHRNALNSHVYWMLRDEGKSGPEATKVAKGLSVPEKNELLFRGGVNFNDLPAWQKRGVGTYWENYEKVGRNPETGEEKVAQRRRLVRDFELPVRDAYSAFLDERAVVAGLN